MASRIRKTKETIKYIRHTGKFFDFDQKNLLKLLLKFYEIKNERNSFTKHISFHHKQVHLNFKKILIDNYHFLLQHNYRN